MVYHQRAARGRTKVPIPQPESKKTGHKQEATKTNNARASSLLEGRVFPVNMALAICDPSFRPSTAPGGTATGAPGGGESAASLQSIEDDLGRPPGSSAGSADAFPQDVQPGKKQISKKVWDIMAFASPAWGHVHTGPYQSGQICMVLLDCPGDRGGSRGLPWSS